MKSTTPAFVGELHCVLEQVVERRGQLAAVAEHRDRRGGFLEFDLDAPLLGRRPDSFCGFGHDEVDEHGFARWRLLVLDARQIQQVVDDPRDAECLGVDPLRETPRHLGFGLGKQRLGEKPERTHRRLQLVADVGDEVPADFLEPTPLGDVIDDGDDPERPLAVVDGLRSGPTMSGAAGRKARGCAPRKHPATSCRATRRPLARQERRRGGCPSVRGRGCYGRPVHRARHRRSRPGRGNRGPGAAGWRLHSNRRPPRPHARSRARRDQAHPRSASGSLGSGSAPSRSPRATSLCFSACTPRRLPMAYATPTSTTKMAAAIGRLGTVARRTAITATAEELAHLQHCSSGEVSRVRL